MPTPRAPRPAAALTLLAALALAGCEDAVDPFIDAGRYFTVYGYLDTDRDSQFVRVLPLRRRVDVPPPGPLVGVTVTTTDLETNETVAWRDSVVAFDDGTSGNVFVGLFRPQYGHRYRLAVRRDDGAETTATTAVPQRREAEVAAPSFDPFLPGSIDQPVRWPVLGVRPLRVQVWYRLAPATLGRPFRDVPLTYEDVDYGAADGAGWRVVAHLSRDVQKVQRTVGADLPALYGVGMKVSVPDGAWRAPNGVFDPDILIEPGTFTNVQNGFGFFGSVAQWNAEWTLPRDVTEALGFPWPNR